MNDSVLSAIGGAIVTGIVALFFKWINSLKNKKEAADEKTIAMILTKLEEESRKELTFMEQWGAMKNEVSSISSASVAIKAAATEILVMRRDLETCFRRVDDLKTIYADNNQLLRTANARLFILRQVLEKNEIKIDAESWLKPQTEV